MPAEVDNYLYELARVLKPGGRCLTTCFLWNQASAALAEKLTAEDGAPLFDAGGDWY